MAHPKVIDRAADILAKDEQEALAEISDITNITVLNVLYQQERDSETQRKSIIELLKEKLGKEGDEVSDEATESLSQAYLEGIVESEQEVVTFTTSLNHEEEDSGSSPDNPKLSESS